MKAKVQVIKFLKTDLGFVICAFLIWRILLFAIGWAANLSFDYVSLPHPFNEGNFLSVWANWDGGHYINIAYNGYIGPNLTAFFPMYPMLLRFVSLIVQYSVISGLIVSGAAIVMAGYWLIKLVKLDFSEKIARNSFILLLLFPTAVFLGAVYSESLFLMTTIGAIYFARKKNWWAVLFLGFAAGLTRNLGAFLVFPLLYEYFMQFRFKIRWPILAVGSPGFAIVSYMVYLWAQFGDPLLFLHQQVNWGRKIVVNVFWRFQEAFNSALNSIEKIEFICVVFAVILIILMIKKLRPSYIIWSIILLLIPVMQNTWISMNRFVLVIFPAFIILSFFGDRYKYLNHILYILFGAGLIYYTALFVNLGWAG
ncbi:mannosyltransferase family protein [Patescibacteria group bacterium]